MLYACARFQTSIMFHVHSSLYVRTCNSRVKSNCKRVVASIKYKKLPPEICFTLGFLFLLLSLFFYLRRHLSLANSYCSRCGQLMVLFLSLNWVLRACNAGLLLTHVWHLLIEIDRVVFTDGFFGVLLKYSCEVIWKIIVVPFEAYLESGY